MKRIYNFILATVALASTTGCTDVLNTSPYNQVSTTTMWSNPSLTNQGVAGVYAQMRGWGVYGATSFDNRVPPFECLGISGEAYRSIAYLQGTAGAGDAFFSGLWKKMYEGVHRANDGIAHLSQEGGGGVDNATRLRLLSECKFMRAYYYMRLNELYGRNGLGVPLYTEPLKSVDECIKGQSPEADVWALIVQDLTDCINEPNFPNHWQEKGRASKGAAYALRGRSYLMQGARYNFKNADKSVTPVMDNALLQKACADFAKVGECGYSLFQGGYKELFTLANEGCDEMIFSLQNIAKTDYGSKIQRMAGTRSAGGVDLASSGGYSQYNPANATVDLYEYKDGTPFDWDAIIPNYWNTTPENRLVYWLRDAIVNGAPVSAALKTKIDEKLSPLDTKGEYLPSGNEARLKKAWENRDPRLYANVLLPYGDIFYGVGNDLRKTGDTTPVPYVYRWPVVTSSYATPIAEQQNAGITSPYDIIPDGLSNVEYAYRHRKFVMEGYTCEYLDDNPIDEPLLRYAYVLSMWAEALAQQGDLSGAAQKINQIRERKSVEMPGYTFSDKEDAMTKIRNEVRREFMGESIDFYEEMRWGTLYATKYSKFMNYEPCDHMVTGQQTNGNGGVSWSSTNDYSIFPVPSEEVEKNPNLTKTPGWKY